MINNIVNLLMPPPLSNKMCITLTLTTRCNCCSFCKSDNVIGDNCCMCNFAAMTKMAELDRDDIFYVNNRVEVTASINTATLHHATLPHRTMQHCHTAPCNTATPCHETLPHRAMQHCHTAPCNTATPHHATRPHRAMQHCTMQHCHTAPCNTATPRHATPHHATLRIVLYVEFM